MQIQRGFHRIGLAGLVPFCALSLLCFAFALYSWLTAWSYGDPGPWTYEDERVFLGAAAGVAALVAGGLWYLAAWAVGWIVAGFRD